MSRELAAAREALDLAAFRDAVTKLDAPRLARLLELPLVCALLDNLRCALGPHTGVGAIPEAGAVNILWSAGLFRDGFESAATAAWSGVVAN